MSGTSLNGRVTLTIFVIVLTSLTLSAVLNYLKFQKVLERNEHARYEFIAYDLRGVIEDSMRIGLPLSSLRSTQALLDRRRAADRYIARITVFDETGLRLYDTDRTAAANVPSGWVHEALHPNARPSAAAGSTIIEPLANNYGRIVAGLALQYSEVGLQRTLQAISVILEQAILEAALPSMLALVAGVALVLRDTRRRLNGTRNAVFNALTETVAGDPSLVDQPRPVPEHIEDAIEDALAVIRRTEHSLEAIDAR